MENRRINAIRIQTAISSLRGQMLFTNSFTSDNNLEPEQLLVLNVIIIIMWGEVGALTSPVFQHHVLLLVNLFRGFDLLRRHVEHDTMLLGCGGRLRYSH